MSASDEQVSQFMSVTGSADPQQAAQYLEMSGGSLETAVGLFMEHGAGMGGGAPMPGAAGGAGGMGAGGDGNFAAAMSPQVRAPDATRTMRLMDDDVGPHPAYQLMNAMMEEELAQSTFASSPAPSRGDARAAVNAAAAESKIDDDDNTGEEGKDNDEGEEDDDLQVVGTSGPPAPARLADMFAPPDHLMHKAGGFQGARTTAKDSRRWLLVNLQRDSEFSCHAMNRDVWRDELVENLVREGFIFWQAWDVSAEGRTYSERYQVHDYPHLAIIDPRTGRLMWRKEGWTQQNALTAESFAEIAMDFCSRNSFDRPPTAPRPPNGAAASRPSKRPMHEMSEDEQLQAAMRASLESTTSQDQDEPMQIGDDDEVEVLDKSASEDAKQPAVTEAIAAEETSGPGSSFLDELVALDIGEEPASGARVQFRMPDGKRIIRKFAAADSAKNVYAFVAQSMDEANTGREFTMMAGFPPRDLLDDIENTVDNSKLSGETITVRWK